MPPSRNSELPVPPPITPICASSRPTSQGITTRDVSIKVRLPPSLVSHAISPLDIYFTVSLSTISISEFGIYLTFPPPLLLAIHLEVNPTSHTPRYTPPRLRLGIQNHLSSCPSIRILRRLKSVISGSISTTKSDTCHLRTVLFEKPELAQFVLKRRMKRAANTQYRRS